MGTMPIMYYVVNNKTKITSKDQTKIEITKQTSLRWFSISTGTSYPHEGLPKTWLNPVVVGSLKAAATNLQSHKSLISLYIAPTHKSKAYKTEEKHYFVRQVISNKEVPKWLDLE